MSGDWVMCEYEYYIINRYGFVGRNGLGKTTLLRMISEKQLMIPSHISVLHVEQEVGGSGFD